MVSDLVNETINATIDATVNQTVTEAGFWNIIVNDIAPNVFQRLTELIKAPFLYPEMIWIVTPMVITLLIMEFYFGRYKKEELGWNTAVGNSLVLLFVSLDLLRFIYHNPTTTFANYYMDPIKTVVAAGVGFYGLMLLFLDFFHFLPKKLAFFLASSLPINVTAYIAITVVYSGLIFDRYTIGAAVAMFLVLFIFFRILRFVIPGFEDPMKASLKE
ncbi:hypothetical protein ACFL0W_03730 [Nanoarchaeota archaeon]